jgi:hypothetical protein
MDVLLILTMILTILAITTIVIRLTTSINRWIIVIAWTPANKETATFKLRSTIATRATLFNTTARINPVNIVSIVILINTVDIYIVFESNEYTKWIKQVVKSNVFFKQARVMPDKNRVPCWCRYIDGVVSSDKNAIRSFADLRLVCESFCTGIP